ncbi:MAG: WbqC family protein [Ignavibacteria bacterium]|nr:WbqC family protein [Ignavibacteria bacterium]
MKKNIAILQSNYIPWKGYFDLIARSDEFILYDEMQYTKNDWRNRNKIKTLAGTMWLTIPVSVKSLHQKINETRIADKSWIKKHKNAIITNYSKALYYKEFSGKIFSIYEELEEEECLSKINQKFINEICILLGIKTKIMRSEDYNLIEGKTERLVDLCKQAGATEYLSGPAAKGYLKEKLFEEAGINVTWMDYSGYSEYSQLFLPFDHYVSIIDLILNEGSNSSNYLKYVNK